MSMVNIPANQCRSQPGNIVPAVVYLGSSDSARAVCGDFRPTVSLAVAGGTNKSAIFLSVQAAPPPTQRGFENATMETG